MLESQSKALKTWMMAAWFPKQLEPKKWLAGLAPRAR